MLLFSLNNRPIFKSGRTQLNLFLNRDTHMDA